MIHFTVSGFSVMEKIAKAARKAKKAQEKPVAAGSKPKVPSNWMGSVASAQNMGGYSSSAEQKPRNDAFVRNQEAVKADEQLVRDARRHGIFKEDSKPAAFVPDEDPEVEDDDDSEESYQDPNPDDPVDEPGAEPEEPQDEPVEPVDPAPEPAPEPASDPAPEPAPEPVVDAVAPEIDPAFVEKIKGIVSARDLESYVEVPVLIDFSNVNDETFAKLVDIALHCIINGPVSVKKPVTIPKVGDVTINKLVDCKAKSWKAFCFTIASECSLPPVCKTVKKYGKHWPLND